MTKMPPKELLEQKLSLAIFLSQLHGNNVLSQIFMGNVYYNSVNDYVIFHTNCDPQIINIVLDIYVAADEYCR